MIIIMFFHYITSLTAYQYQCCLFHCLLYLTFEKEINNILKSLKKQC